jgi:hypothetical protein
MKKQIRYELLRIAPKLPSLDHDSVGGAIARHMQHALPIARQSEHFIPPWFDTVRYGSIIIGWGNSSTYPSGEEREIYIVERERIEPLYMVRSTVLDMKDFPLKEDAIAVGFNLPLREALRRKATLQKQFSDRFFDIYPQDL